MREHGFRGIKVHRHDARITREICDVARAFALPVLYDVMGETSAVELIATEYPDVAFVIPHLGIFADDFSGIVFSAAETDRQFLGVRDHVKVGEDVPLLVNN